MYAVATWVKRTCTWPADMPALAKPCVNTSWVPPKHTFDPLMSSRALT